MHRNHHLAAAGVITVLAATCTAATNLPRLPDGQPLACIYYFGHWWDPWKSNDDAIRSDFVRLRELGFNTICLDHEWSQAIDGNWRWLDREQRLAKEAGLAIIPWLSLKSWSDLIGGNRLELAKAWYGTDIRRGENQDGTPGAPLVYDDSVISFGAAYTCDYIRRYGDQALLRLKWADGNVRPVVCLGVESAWVGSFDNETNRRFRSWLRERYTTIAAVNQAWGTQFAAFADIDPRNKVVFDYTQAQEGKTAHPQAVEDHVEFRSQTLSTALGAMGDRVRETYPDVLLLAEIPYQYGSVHPHAQGYRITYAANPSSCSYADIVMFRNTGPLNQAEAEILRRTREATGQAFILTYRTYSDWDTRQNSPHYTAAAALYGEQPADLDTGIGFYSWNEMVDTHVAYAPNPPREIGWTEERAERAITLMGAILARYRERLALKTDAKP